MLTSDKKFARLPFYAFLMVALDASAQTTSPVLTPSLSTTISKQPRFSQNSVLQQPLLVAPYLEKAESLNLANHITWRRLLHYPDNTHNLAHSTKILLSDANSPLTKDQNHSQISDDSFFVSPNGKNDPHAEIVAMLNQLFSENSQTVNSVQCRFPARTHWLKQLLSIKDSDLPAIDCPDTTAWLNQINPDSAWLIFAEEYLESPASAFGHSFLRLDNANTQKNYILNYEPKVTEGENFLKFTYKSSIAGNAGVFTVLPYEEKIKQYRDHDGRDIWRYQLNLSKDELQQLARQIWEIKDQHPTYYLASDNCASEILLLLNALRPDKNYLQDFNKIVAPADIVRALDRQGVIKTAVYEPSLKSKQQAQLNARAAIKKGQTVSNTKGKLPFLPADNNPQTANPLSVASVAIGQENGNTFTQLGYRGVYHDDLDKRTGYPVGYYLEALSAKVRLLDTTDGHEQHARLEEATLIKARSLNPINTAESQKPWGGNSWGAQIGLTQVADGFDTNNANDFDSSNDTHNRHLVANLGAEYGWSMAYGSPYNGNNDSTTQFFTVQTPPNICYALGTGTAQFGKGLTKGYRVGLGATLGCIQQFRNNLRGTIALDLPYWYQHNGGEHLDHSRFQNGNQHGYWQPQASVGVQYDISNHHAVRFNGNYIWQPNHLGNDKTGQLAYLYYF